MKIASMKKARPSIAKPRPNAEPKRPIIRGHRMPNSKERMVPATAPTANCTAITTDQRRAILSATLSFLASPMPSIRRVRVGRATPSGTKMTWYARVKAIWIRLGRRADSLASQRVDVIMAVGTAEHLPPSLRESHQRIPTFESLRSPWHTHRPRAGPYPSAEVASGYALRARDAAVSVLTTDHCTADDLTCAAPALRNWSVGTLDFGNCRLHVRRPSGSNGRLGHNLLGHFLPPTGVRKPTAKRFQPLIATMAVVRATNS